MIEAFVALLLTCFVAGPVMWESLPTCDMTRPIVKRCREVRGQWSGEVDGRIHEGGTR